MLGPLLVDIAGTRLTAEDRELLRHPLVGGVILFARNCPDADSVRDLAEAVHALRTPPLLIAVDQEGGRVQRVRDGVTRLPALALIGAQWERDRAGARELARDAGWLMAAEMLALGADVSFAPVVDLGGRSRVIGDRAFHRDPEAVAELGVAYARGMADAGMHAVAKHFPEHGGVAEDTHVERPVDRRELADLELADLRPYARLIGAGLSGVMMSHVVYPAVAPEPASLSRRWVHDILRDRYGFQGAVIADDLSMDAASVAGLVPERVRRALAAGCDLAPVCNDRAAVAALLAGREAMPESAASGLRRSRLAPAERPDPADLAGDGHRRRVREALAALERDDGFHLE